MDLCTSTDSNACEGGNFLAEPSLDRSFRPKRKSTDSTDSRFPGARRIVMIGFRTIHCQEQRELSFYKLLTIALGHTGLAKSVDTEQLRKGGDCKGSDSKRSPESPLVESIRMASGPFGGNSTARGKSDHRTYEYRDRNLGCARWSGISSGSSLCSPGMIDSRCQSGE
jgi:hypothetical protein